VNVTQQLSLENFGSSEVAQTWLSFSMSSFPMVSSSHSILCLKPAIAKASLLVPPIPISVSGPPIVLGATSHSSAYPLWRVLVLGVGRGVPGEEWEWKLGGGEEGIEGVRIDGV